MCVEQVYNAEETTFTEKMYHGRRLLQPLSNQLLEEKNVNKEYLFFCAAMLPEVTN